MTCIVGLVEKGKVFIGGDSAGTASTNLRIRKDSKVFKTGPYVFGFTSSFRMGQLLQYQLKLPKPPKENENLFKFMCTEFIEAVRKCLRNGGYGSDREGGCFLVGVHGQLFKIEEDYQVIEEDTEFTSVGGGEHYAMGSLASTKGTAEERILKALEVAEKFCAGVRRPFIIINSDSK